MRVQFERFYTYAELTETLEAWASEHPTLFSFEAIGKSYEGRDIWLCTVTNTETGPPDEKPAVFIHAQIHAMEFTGHDGGARSPRPAPPLRRRARAPRASTRARSTSSRASTRTARTRGSPTAASAARACGRTRATSPRTACIATTSTATDASSSCACGIRTARGSRIRTTPRALVARAPDDVEGDFYRVLPEGTIHNWDGVTIPIAPPLEGLDLNRNWPADWAPEAEQQGAGPFPTSEPEVRALVEAIVARKNITSYVGYHTFSGVHLRPWSGRSDDDFPVPDLRAFKIIGEEATRLTGYPSISIFHDFKYHPKMVIKGGDVDWIYDHLGAYAWVTEFWSPQRAAGLEEYHFIDWLREHSPEDELAVLKVADEYGEGYVDWYPFEHPQLGPVELGGWDLVRFWFNPPLARLEEEVKPHADFAVYLALIAPRLEIRSFESEPVADGAFRLRLVLENAGWLPTNVTEKAVERKAVRPIEVELTVPDGARIASGKPREEAGQLAGRVERRQITWWGTDHSTAERALVEWVVEAKAGDTRLGGRAPRARGHRARRARPLGARDISPLRFSMPDRRMVRTAGRGCGSPRLPDPQPADGEIRRAGVRRVPNRPAHRRRRPRAAEAAARAGTPDRGRRRGWRRAIRVGFPGRRAVARVDMRRVSILSRRPGEPL